MLHGHLDEVSHQSIQGWAADDARPDEPVDISVFIDGRKVAQVACNRPREDLAQTGQYGNGRHGFSYRFGTALSQVKDIHLSVRFSQSGASLSRGECILNSKGVRVLLEPAPLLDDEPVTMPAPRNPRALLDLIVLHDAQLGLAPLLSRLELDRCKPRDLHYAVFGKVPEANLSLSLTERYYPRDHLQELLLSPAFQADMLPVLLNAYGDKQRLFFLHIPKCAGTDLSNKLKTRYPWVDFNIMDPDWTSKEAMLRHLSRLAGQLRFADAIYLCGHAMPNYYAHHGLVRPMDRVFTVVRHPFEIMISQVNYVLTRFWFDAERGEIGPDTQKWLQLIGIDTLPDKLTEEFAMHAGMQVLHNTDIVKPNSLCYWLNGDEADARSALESLVAQDVEVTDTHNYGTWLAQRWNIRSQTRDNSSMKFLQVDMLSADDQDYMREISVEDRKLYQIIERSIADMAKPSAIGQELLYGAD